MKEWYKKIPTIAENILIKATRLVYRAVIFSIWLKILIKLWL